MVIEVPLSLPATKLTEPSEGDKADMEKLLSDGKRNFVCGQNSHALECFADLCERLAKFYGQESDKCVETYLYYAKCLLEMGRLENGVLGHAINEAGAINGVDEECEAEEDMETGEDIRTGIQDVENKAKKDDEGMNGDDVSDTEDGDEDDISNMELSWQMFELTVLICNRQLTESKDKEVKLNLAEAKSGLAQISQETEQHEEAVKDFTECLNIYKDILEDKNDRRLAEAHYNIAISLSFDKKYTEAIEHFEAAVAILKGRIADLEAKIKEAENTGVKEKAPAELEGWKKEVNELNELILDDLTAKIEDAHESKKLLDESIKNVKNVAMELFSSFGGTKSEFDGGFDSGFDAGFDAPLSGHTEIVNDISSKVRSTKQKSNGGGFESGLGTGSNAPLPGHTEVVHDISSKMCSTKRKSDSDATSLEKRVKSLNVDVAKEE